MIKRKYLAVVQEDMTLKYLNPAEVKTALLKFKGQTIEFSFDKKRKPRTLDQNAYYHGVVLPMIAEYCGYRGSDEITGLHEHLKQQFLPKHGKLQITRSTASLTTVEFSTYVEDVRRWASEQLGVYIPDPSGN